MRRWIFIIQGLFLVTSCRSQNDLHGYEIELFKEVAWEFAKAVEKEDTIAIQQIVNAGNVYVDVREEKYGQTLLIWAISQNKYNSTKKLLDLGADPNLQDYYEGMSAVIAAADKHETSEFLKLVLNYGGDPNNKVEMDNVVSHISPLSAAAKNRLESVKILVKAGADINYGLDKGQSPLFEATYTSQVEIVRYLLIEKGAEFNKPMRIRDDGSASYITNFMRHWIFPLDSKEYMLKMEIVDYLMERGMDYRKTEIPKDIHRNYPADYVEKY